jgi:DNA-binding transcriptional regulator YdaS (Cro superfamily)
MKKSTLAALNRAIAQFDGAPGLARAMGIPNYPTINAWKKARIPAEHCPHIELLTGERCELLRPDVMWHVLRAQPGGGGQAVVGGAEGDL